MNEGHKRKISKYLSFILRHHPEHIGLKLDENGWANIQELIVAAGRDKVELTTEMIRVVVESNDKQRFSFSEDGTKIRANQGHSISVDLQLPPETPPDILLHGTSTKALKQIRLKGLDKKDRNYVHLHIDPTAARDVGRRHGEPFVLQINSKQMSLDGLLFYKSKNGIWLTDHVPVEYIIFEEP